MNLLSARSHCMMLFRRPLSPRNTWVCLRSYHCLLMTKLCYVHCRCIASRAKTYKPSFSEMQCIRNAGGSIFDRQRENNIQGAKLWSVLNNQFIYVNEQDITEEERSTLSLVVRVVRLGKVQSEFSSKKSKSDPSGIQLRRPVGWGVRRAI